MKRASQNLPHMNMIKSELHELPLKVNNFKRMKKSIIIISFLFAVVFTSCRNNNWGQRGNICTSIDKTSVQTGETVSVSSCGDEPPSEYVETELDWGDGTITSGLSGSHNYSSADTFYIKVLMNGDYAADVIDVDESKVKHEVIVQ
ncbi:MAG: hypothetical protein ABFS35_18380 [Bacteroidota bacterium]